MWTLADDDLTISLEEHEKIDRIAQKVRAWLGQHSSYREQLSRLSSVTGEREIIGAACQISVLISLGEDEDYKKGWIIVMGARQGLQPVPKQKVAPP